VNILYLAGALFFMALAIWLPWLVNSGVSDNLILDILGTIPASLIPLFQLMSAVLIFWCLVMAIGDD